MRLMERAQLPSPARTVQLESAREERERRGSTEEDREEREGRAIGCNSVKENKNQPRGEERRGKRLVRTKERTWREQKSVHLTRQRRGESGRPAHSRGKRTTPPFFCLFVAFLMRWRKQTHSKLKRRKTVFDPSADCGSLRWLLWGDAEA